MDRQDAPYWHFALHVFATALFAQPSNAEASFFGFAAVGAVADSMHAAAPDEQPWIPSRVD